MGSKLVIDIGSYFVKIIEGHEKRSNLRIKQIKYVENPVPDIKTTEDERKQEIFVNFLKKVINESRIKTKQLITAVSNHEVITHIFEIPNIPEEEIENAVKLEIIQIIPDGIKNFDYDYTVIPWKGKKEIIFVGYPKNKINSLLNIFSKCRLNPVIIDYDCFAILNFIKKYFKTQEIIFALNIGYSVTNFLLSEKEGFILIRDIPMGIRHFISLIANYKNLSFEEAKIFYLKSENSSEIKNILKNSLIDYFSEIKTGIEYFRNKTNSSPSILFLTGGISLWENSKDLFEEELNVSTEILNPLNQYKETSISLDMKRKGPIFTVSCGLLERTI